MVTQCLVALAVSEPGENWDGETIDGCEFELPSTWIKQPPRRGVLEVHYRTDHESEESQKSRLRRGDNFALRQSWFRRTLQWAPGLEARDVGFRGHRSQWKAQRSWVVDRLQTPS